MVFNELTPNAEQVLRDILEHRRENGTCDIPYWEERFAEVNSAKRKLLRSIFDELSDRNMISVYWSNKGPYRLIVLDYGVSYFSTKKDVKEREKAEKEMAEKQDRKMQASAFVNGQPIVGGMRIMDSASEEMLKAILSCYDGNEKRYVEGNSSVFPEAYTLSLDVEFYKLYFYGVTTEAIINILGEWSVYLTPNGITYFSDKDKAKKRAEEIHMPSNQRKQYDVFLSHASKDKSDYVESLYMVLRRLGISIFYDSDSISWGDNWKQAILKGTAVSEFAIIVISENFFGREWTERELSEFLKRQNESGQKIVLPLLHNITLDQLKEHYPELEEIQIIDTATKTKEEITILFAKELIKRYK